MMVEICELSSTAADDWSQQFTPVRRFGESVAEFFSPSSEAATTIDNYEISIELPGVGDDDNAVEIHDGRLTVSGEKRSSHEEKANNFYFSERTYGKFRRGFRLPDDADDSKVPATHKDGVLTIQIAKVAPTAAKVKTVEIVRG